MQISDPNLTLQQLMAIRAIVANTELQHGLGRSNAKITDIAAPVTREPCGHSRNLGLAMVPGRNRDTPAMRQQTAAALIGQPITDSGIQGQPLPKQQHMTGLIAGKGCGNSRAAGSCQRH